ncbi:hypothetical protein XELAEV_18037348mg [Xenopus laevis]|uniref:Uncharacterized protein n=1 Tax=Xenopus laevis TaxID=8355 RepID=A0A974HA34_XENLA|nr:hypothetical protein XELAEV_18037348mg [Xenopus laevis]
MIKRGMSPPPKKTLCPTCTLLPFIIYKKKTINSFPMKKIGVFSSTLLNNHRAYGTATIYVTQGRVPLKGM